MTLSQLRAFVLVARLGSVRAAASELGVSEPAVSGAIAALRKELGDDLYVRAGGGLTVTAGGRRLAARAVEILGLAEAARREVADARGAQSRLRIAATGAVAEYAAPPVIALLTRRFPGLEVELAAEPADDFGATLVDRRADVTLGPAPLGAAFLAVPFLRARVVVVGGARHRLAGHAPVPARALATEPWLVGPDGLDPSGAVGRWLARQRVLPRDVRVFASSGSALAAVARGQGVGLAILHTVRADLRGGTLVVLPVQGTPLDERWSATTLGHDRLPDAASALQRLLTTPEATQAIVSGPSGPSGTPPARMRPSVYVTLWS